jgi:hypothetical protein
MKTSYHNGAKKNTPPFPATDVVTTTSTISIEIAPGHFASLRGSQETAAAIDDGYATRATCFCCDATLICIADAEFVLCPTCKVVSPILSSSDDHDHDECMRGLVYGVGLGLIEDNKNKCKQSW